MPYVNSMSEDRQSIPRMREHDRWPEPPKEQNSWQNHHLGRKNIESLRVNYLILKREKEGRKGTSRTFLEEKGLDPKRNS